MKTHINDDFLNFISLTYKYKNRQFKKHLKKVEYMKTQDKQDIGMIQTNNISKSMEFCNKYKIEINEIYDTYATVKNEDIIKMFFQRKPNINLKNIQQAQDSAYSITKPSVAHNI